MSFTLNASNRVVHRHTCQASVMFYASAALMATPAAAEASSPDDGALASRIN